MLIWLRGNIVLLLITYYERCFIVLDDIFDLPYNNKTSNKKTFQPLFLPFKIPRYATVFDITLVE